MIRPRNPVALIPAGPSLEPAQHLCAMDCHIVIHCETAQDISQAIDTAFAGMRPRCATAAKPDIELTARQSGNELSMLTDRSHESAHDLGDLLYLLDKRITLDLQRIRKDLYFLHGGAVRAPDGRVIVITAASGAGKSTLTWALLHHGFDYLSDELAPVEPASLQVHGYPHALCLKSRPNTYPLPDETLVTRRSLHVPVAMAHPHGRLAAVLFVDHRLPENTPLLTTISPARSAMQLYANALNPLAHANDGLDTATVIARSVPGFQVNTSDLKAACEEVVRLL